MQLRNARLCLDCEEVHDAQQCPACASETFAFMTRWVPAPERRAQPRPVEPAQPDELDTYRQMLEADRRNVTGWRLIRRGAMGLALFGVAGWMWRRNDQTRAGASAHTGESPREDAAEAAPPPARSDSRPDPRR